VSRSRWRAAYCIPIVRSTTTDHQPILLVYVGIVQGLDANELKVKIKLILIKPIHSLVFFQINF